MLIDDFLPKYNASATYSAEIKASPEKIYNNIYSLNLGESFIVRFLFLLRGMPAKSVTLEGLQNSGFVKLGEIKNKELLLGLVGKFWTPTGQLQKVTPEEFVQFNERGFAKAAWNFSLAENSNNSTQVQTETRIFCPDETSRKHFLRYWRFIGPFSGWTRKEALRILKGNVEKIITDVK